jgi:hypothetical protein
MYSEKSFLIHAQVMYIRRRKVIKYRNKQLRKRAPCFYEPSKHIMNEINIYIWNKEKCWIFKALACNLRGKACDDVILARYMFPWQRLMQYQYFVLRPVRPSCRGARENVTSCGSNFTCLFLSLSHITRPLWNSCFKALSYTSLLQFIARNFDKFHLYVTDTLAEPALSEAWFTRAGFLIT